MTTINHKVAASISKIGSAVVGGIKRERARAGESVCGGGGILYSTVAVLELRWPDTAAYGHPQPLPVTYIGQKAA